MWQEGETSSRIICKIRSLPNSCEKNFLIFHILNSYKPVFKLMLIPNTFWRQLFARERWTQMTNKIFLKFFFRETQYNLEASQISPRGAVQSQVNTCFHTQGGKKENTGGLRVMTFLLCSLIMWQSLSASAIRGQWQRLWGLTSGFKKTPCVTLCWPPSLQLEQSLPCSSAGWDSLPPHNNLRSNNSTGNKYVH